MSQEGFNVNDLVICNNGCGKLVGGGFELNSGMLGHSTLLSTDGGKKKQKGGSAIVSSLKGLAVPAGLLYLQKSMKDRYYEFDNKDTVIDESLFDKLYDLAQDNSSDKTTIKKRKSTRRSKNKTNKKSSKRQTRRKK